MKLKDLIKIKKKDETKSVRLHGDNRAYWYNYAIDEIGNMELLLSENELTEVIATYHVELGKRMILDNGRNEKVSPSRELAKFIKAKLPQILTLSTDKRE